MQILMFKRKIKDAEILSIPDAINQLKQCNHNQIVDTLKICSTSADKYGNRHSSKQRKQLAELLANVRIKNLCLINFPYCPPDFIGPMDESSTLKSILKNKDAINAENIVIVGLSGKSKTRARASRKYKQF